MAFKVTPTYSTKLKARLKWQAVIKDAQKHLSLNFCQSELSPGKLQVLATLIDKTFLNGSFAKACKPKYAVQERLSGNVTNLSETAVLNAVAGFEPDSNTLIFFKKGWQRKPSLRRPVQADGVYCLSKLEWLVHALGHEMVHCIVHNACPKAREYDAYKTDNGHGPIFMRLNK
ncbi:hypothetical protein OEZ86_004935 [Tetradesmus obliquus]|nr:hypothetical protein OEZ86_004935 [Tetradesmus obliquus]